MLQQPAQKIGTLRIVCFALAAGLTIFTAVAVTLRMQGIVAPAPQAASMLPIVVAITFVSSVGMWFVLRKKFLDEAAKAKTEALEMLREDKVPHLIGTATIIGAAMFEGPGLLGAVTVLVGGEWYCLAAPIIAILAIVWMIPSRESVEDALRSAGS